MRCTGIIKLKCNCGCEKSIQCNEFQNWDIVFSTSTTNGGENILEDSIDYNCENCYSTIRINAIAHTNPNVPNHLVENLELKIEGGKLIENNCNCIL